MESFSPATRQAFGFGIAALIVVMLGMGMAAALVLREHGLARFPGAMQMSVGSSYVFEPRPKLRRDSSFRTDAPFAAVSDWYARAFALHPAQRALHNCIQMDDIARMWIIHRYVSVVICDTPDGRMVYVQRTVWLR